MRLNIFLIVCILLLAVSVSAKLSDEYIVSKEELNDGLKGSIPITEKMIENKILVDNKEYVAVDKTLILMPDHKTIQVKEDNVALVTNNDKEINIYGFESRNNENIVIESYNINDNICLDFLINTTDIQVKSIKRNGVNIKNKEYRINNKICYSDVNVTNATYVYQLVLNKNDKIKYNVIMGDVVLDPYLIGSLATDNQLGLYFPFNGNISNVWSSVSSTFTASIERFYESYSVTVTNLCYNSGNSVDSNYATGMLCVCDGAGNGGVGEAYHYFNKTSMTGAILESYDSYSGKHNITVPDACLAYNSSHIAVKNVLYGACGGIYVLRVYCYDSGGSPVEIYSTGDTTSAITFYDNYMYLTNAAAYTAYVNPLVKTQYYNTRDLVWSNTYSFWGNDSVFALKNDMNTSQTAVVWGTAPTYNSTGLDFYKTSSQALNITLNNNLTSYTLYSKFILKNVVNTSDTGDYVLHGKNILSIANTTSTPSSYYPLFFYDTADVGVVGDYWTGTASYSAAQYVSAPNSITTTAGGYSPGVSVYNMSNVTYPFKLNLRMKLNSGTTRIDLGNITHTWRHGLVKNWGANNNWRWSDDDGSTFISSGISDTNWHYANITYYNSSWVQIFIDGNTTPLKNGTTTVKMITNNSLFRIAIMADSANIIYVDDLQVLWNASGEQGTVSTNYTNFTSDIGIVEKSGVLACLNNNNGWTLRDVYANDYTLANNTAYDVACTFNLTHTIMYVNGVYVNSTENDNTTNYNISKFVVGRLHNTTSYDMNGTIENVMIYNRSLSAEEIYILHNSGNFSTNNKGEANKSIYLNGWEAVLVSNYSQVTNLYPNSSFTSSYWYNSPGNYDVFGNNKSTKGIQLAINTYYANINNMSFLYYPSYTNTWTNNVNRYNGNTFSQYTNGNLINSTAYYGGFYGGSTTGFPLIIGSSSMPSYGHLYNDGRYYKGYLDELLFFTKALTSEEIDILYGGYNNSIYFNIKDAKTFNTITSMIYINVYSNTTGYNKLLTTSTGEVYTTGIPEGIYRFTAYSLENNTYATSVIYNTYITDNSQYNVTFYMSNQTGESTQQVLLIVRDASDQGLEDATIGIYAQNPSTGETYLTQSPKTNINGQYLASLIRDSIYYSFVISYNNQICYQTSKPFIIQISDATIYFRCITGVDYITRVNKYNNINVSIQPVNTSNVTGYFNVIANSLYSGNICFDIYRNPSSENLNLYNNCVNYTSYLNTVYLNASNMTKDTIYQAVVSFTPNGENQPVIINSASLLFRIEPHIGWGNVGYFLFFLLIILVASYFVKHPSLIAISLGGIWLIACRIGLFDFGANTMTVGYIGLFIGIVVGFAIETRNR